MSSADETKAETEISLGGEKRVLSLKIGDIVAIERRLDLGLGKIVDRLREDYRVEDIAVIYHVALARAGQKLSIDDVYDMLPHEPMTEHVVNCIGLIVAALRPLPGGPQKPDAAKH